MAEVEPSRIWAVAGLLVVSIYGMTYVQLRSSGASISEVASLVRAGSSVEPVKVTPQTSSDYSIYEAGYVGGGRSAYQPSVNLNPVAPSQLYFSSTRPTVDPGLQSEEHSPLTDVVQDIVNPDPALTDVAGIATELRNGQSADYVYASVGIDTPDAFALNYTDPIHTLLGTENSVATVDYYEIEPVPNPNPDPGALYISDLTTAISELPVDLVLNDVSTEQDAYITNTGRIDNAIRFLAFSGENADSSGLSPDQQVQAAVVRQALAEGLVYEQQAQDYELGLVNQQTQQQIGQQAKILADEQAVLMKRVQEQYQAITIQVNGNTQALGWVDAIDDW